MKITIETYNPKWVTDYNTIKKELEQILSFLHPTIEHIGSTSIEGLSAKPIIDILVGIANKNDFEKLIIPLTSNDYIYYEKYNSMMPFRRFFAKLKTKPDTISVQNIYSKKDSIPNELHNHKLAHIHVIEYASPPWVSYITFRDYLRNNEKARNDYQQIKIGLSNLNWRDGNHYSDAKNETTKRIEKEAILWYIEKQKEK